MKRKIFFVVLVAMLLVLSNSGIAAAAGDAPEGVNTFTVSPDPAAAGDTVTIDINANMTAGADGNTSFCLYAPDTAVGTFPGTITLTYYSGFTSTDVDFTAVTDTVCPDRTNQTAKHYTFTSGTLPAGDTTYEGSTTFDIANDATPGTYNWTLLLEEPGSGTNPLSDSHEITAAETPDTELHGRIIDSKTLQPWKYGAEIRIIQTSGENTGLKGSTVVSLADGTWSITLGTTDDLGICDGNCTEGNNYAKYAVQVNFKCDIETTTTGSRPDYTSSTDANCPTTVDGTALTGLPSNFEVEVTDSASGGSVDLGDWETHRGPTAIVLSNFGVNSAGIPAGLVFGLGAVVLLLAAGAFILMRKRATW